MERSHYSVLDSMVRQAEVGKEDWQCFVDRSHLRRIPEGTRQENAYQAYESEAASRT